MIEIPTFPRTAYHPVRGAVTLDTAEHAAQVMTVPTDWFDTAAEADAHRTENEAQVVIHYGRRGQVQKYQDADEGVVHHSVSHQETVDRRLDAADGDAAAAGAPPPTRDATTGAELLT